MGYKNTGGGISGGGSSTGFTDDFTIGVKIDDVNALPIDADNYQIALLQSDTNDVQNELLELKFPSGVFDDSSNVPTDARSFLIKVWMSGSAGTDVSNPANANGQNDGTTAVVSTGALASNPEIMTSQIGSNIATITFSSVLYRGWFRAQTTLITSTATVIASSTTGAFSDIVMFTQSSLGGDTNHLTGTFTFDLFSAGVDTLAKLQSLRIYHKCTDAVAGVTPAVLTVDAGSVELNVTL